jgi:hypothetical protein
MDPDTLLRDAVARLIRQLEINEWVNNEGHKITNNIAFQDVKKLLSAS